MKRHRVSYIDKNKPDLENARDLVNNWYQMSKHLPENEMIEKLAYMLAALFRDRTITNDFVAQLSITKVNKTEVECRMHGSEQDLVLCLVNCLGQKPFSQLFMKALMIESVSKMKMPGT